MKIWGELAFGCGLPVLRSVVSALCGLPEPLRAARHSEGEDEVRRPIGDVIDFSISLGNRGAILWAKHANYHVWAPRGGRVACTCEFKAKPLLVTAFMKRMSALNPVFGFAAAWDEFRHRNQVVVKLRVGTSEEFLGMDVSEYVPGVYWLTLLPNALAKRHCVPLAELEMAALEHEALGDGQRLFRFHERPDAWRGRADELDELCDKLPGVFSVAVVRRELARAKVTELSEYNEVTRRWQ